MVSIKAFSGRAMLPVAAVVLGLGVAGLAGAPAAHAEWHGGGAWSGHGGGDRGHWDRGHGGGWGIGLGFYGPAYPYAYPYGYPYPYGYYGYAYPYAPYAAAPAPYPPVAAAPAPAPMAADPASPTFVAPDGQTCREYQSSVMVNGVAQPLHGTACLQPDGSWRVVN